MSNLNSISDVLFGNKFLVPGYQRSYSWRVSTEGKDKEVNQFLSDLKDFTKDSKLPIITSDISSSKSRKTENLK